MNEIFANISDIEQVKNLGKALDSELKIKILMLLDNASFSVHELAEQLKVPVSTVAFNVNQIEKAGLITTELKAASAGLIKICSKKCPSVTIGLISQKLRSGTINKSYSMPIGGYHTFQVCVPCGMAVDTGNIFLEYDSVRFYSPERFRAQILWFSKAGRFCYLFPNEFKQRYESVEKLEISFEACSEAPNFRNDYKSDITLWMNGLEIATWTSPGDFGGRRGKLNPPWWPDAMTQYGMLKHFRITRKGSFLDDVRQGAVTLDDLRLNAQDCIRVEIGVKENAAQKGGMNLFGAAAGDYAQDIVLDVELSSGTHA